MTSLKCAHTLPILEHTISLDCIFENIAHIELKFKDNILELQALLNQCIIDYIIFIFFEFRPVRFLISLIVSHIRRCILSFHIFIWIIHEFNKMKKIETCHIKNISLLYIFRNIDFRTELKLPLYWNEYVSVEFTFRKPTSWRISNL